MARYAVHVEAISQAPIDAVWALLADVTTWPRWSRFDEASYRRHGEPPPHGVGAEREFVVGRSHSVDTVLLFEPPSRLSYTYDGPLPIKDYRADVELTSVDAGTHITWHSEFSNTMPLSGRPVRLLLRKVLRDLVTALADAAESTPRVRAGA